MRVHPTAQRAAEQLRCYLREEPAYWRLGAGSATCFSRRFHVLQQKSALLTTCQSRRCMPRRWMLYRCPPATTSARVPQGNDATFSKYVPFHAGDKYVDPKKLALQVWGARGVKPASLFARGVIGPDVSA
eukprot:331909-Chlamydomonas_euryale.AAC.4